MIKNPDFLIIPFEVVSNKGLQPNDYLVYAVIYWFERMKDGRCVASNKTMAELLNITEGSLANSLNRLDEQKFIVRLYKDQKRRNRLEIKTLVHFTKIDTSNNESTIHQTMNRDTSNDEQNSNTHKVKGNSINTTGVKTPDNQTSLLIDLFKGVNPNHDILFKNTNQRKAIDYLNKRYGFEKVKGMIEFVEKSNGNTYAPNITTPIQLRDNLGKLIAWYKKEQSKGKEREKEIIGFDKVFKQ